MSNSALATELPELETPPVMITLSEQDIGYMYANKTSPREFMQELLARFKQAGAPIEGSAGFLRPAHGVVLKMKTHPSGNPFLFGYLWITSEGWKIVCDYKRDAGFEAYETGMVGSTAVQ